MKRRNFLIAGGMLITTNLCGGLARLLSPDGQAVPTLTLVPTIALPGTNTPAPTSTPAPAPSPTAVPTELPPTPTAEPTVEIDETQPFLDTFTENAPTRVVRADGAVQVTSGEHGLRIQGTASSECDPLIYDQRVIRREPGQVAGARFKVASWKALGRLGLITAEGSGIACIRRTNAEGEGGLLDCGTQSARALNLYSGCWYDLLLFLQEQGAAFAINDGAGPELVLLADHGSENPGYIGYSAPAGTDQDAEIGLWYARGPRYFPPELASEPAPGSDYEVDTTTNAAWVEAQINRVDGCAGFRFRSVDAENEYRIYVDGVNLCVDLVVKGRTSKSFSYPLTDSAGGKLAIRYNELTLSMYYNGDLIGLANRKIGAPEVINGTRVGVYSTNTANTFANFKAYAVRLEPPDTVRQQMLQSRRVLCLGDSLTMADKAFGYQNLLRKQLGEGWVTIDAGVGGQSTFQMFKRLPTHMEHYHPEIVIVLGGTNDIALGLSAELVTGNLQVTYNAAREAGARVAAVTIPPMGSYSRWTSEKQAAIDQVNEWIMGGAGSVDYRVNAYQMLVGHDSCTLAGEYDSGDHLHLNGTGYDLLANLIYQNVRR